MRYSASNFLRDLERPRNQRLAKFGGRRLCGSTDITDLIFQVTLQDHTIKGSRKVKQTASSLYIPALPSLVELGIGVVDI